MQRWWGKNSPIVLPPRGGGGGDDYLIGTVLKIKVSIGSDCAATIISVCAMGF